MKNIQLRGHHLLKIIHYCDDLLLLQQEIIELDTFELYLSTYGYGKESSKKIRDLYDMILFEKYVFDEIVKGLDSICSANCTEIGERCLGKTFNEVDEQIILTSDARNLRTLVRR